MGAFRISTAGLQGNHEAEEDEEGETELLGEGAAESDNQDLEGGHSLGEEGGKTVHDSIPHPDDKLGESVRAIALAAGDSLSSKVLRAIGSLVRKEVQQRCSRHNNRGEGSSRNNTQCMYKCTKECAAKHDAPGSATKYPTCDLPDFSPEGMRRIMRFSRKATKADWQRSFHHCATVLSNTTRPKWGEHKGEWTNQASLCTSCRPDDAFEMTHARSRAGVCRPVAAFGRNIRIRCRALDQNGWQASPSDKNKLCVKFGVITHLFFPQLKKDGPEVFNWFKRGLSKRGKFVNSHAIARCTLAKYIACRNGQCAVRKEVKCLEICNWRLRGGLAFDKKSCDKKLCARPYGSIACSEVAMTT